GTVALWDHPGRFFKLDEACGWLKVIDALRVVGHKGLPPVQSVVLLEPLDQTRQSDGCREHACRTATAFFGGLRVWCRVASKHQFGMGTQCCREQSVAVFWTFGERFAEEMRLQEPASDIIEGIQEMMQSHSSIYIGITVQQCHGLAGGDMFHNDSEPGKARCQIVVHREKFALAIEHKTVRLAMYEQRNSDLLHESQRRDGVLNSLHAGIAVRRHTCRIEFDPDDVCFQTAQCRLVIRLKKQCHIRFEERTVTGGMNGQTETLKPLSVVHRRGEGRDRI